MSADISNTNQTTECLAEEGKFILEGRDNMLIGTTNERKWWNRWSNRLQKKGLFLVASWTAAETAQGYFNSDDFFNCFWAISTTQDIDQDVCEYLLNTPLPKGVRFGEFSTKDHSHSEYNLSKSWNDYQPSKTLLTYRDLMNELGDSSDSRKLPDGTTVACHPDSCILKIQFYADENLILFGYGR